MNYWFGEVNPRVIMSQLPLKSTNRENTELGKGVYPRASRLSSFSRQHMTAVPKTYLGFFIKSMSEYKGGSDMLLGIIRIGPTYICL